MNEEAIREVEQEIGYEFEDKCLLVQAFTRKSYTDEHHGGCNNEILEFYGDRVLDLVVVKELADYYGGVEDGIGYSCTYNESDSTAIKKRLVCSTSLAARMDELGFAKHLRMSRGDVVNNAQNQTHVKEDLFEAIIGAVAVDCGWNLDILQDTVEMMLHLDQYFDNNMTDYEDCVSLVQQWSQKRYGTLPEYHMFAADDRAWHDIYTPNCMDPGPCGRNFEYVCHLYIDDTVFFGYGLSKSSARLQAASLAYEYLEGNGLLITMENEIDAPAPERAVSQLQTLAQKGYFALPEYVFSEDHDSDGNPVWKCECHIDGYEYYYENEASSKKEAKRQAAYEMLTGILNHTNNPTD
ncbi:MAG: putative dsRNA-binding protein [Clostridia bacterium]|nr:putative dsRNA-binding protein [Clostridia bacterium]